MATRAMLRHDARVRTHELACRLGLTPGQTEELLTALLADTDDRAKGPDAHPLDVLWSSGRAGTWLELNLSPEQEEAHAKFQQVLHREKTERNANDRIAEITRVLELTDDQLAAVRERFLGADLPGISAEFEGFVTYGEPIQATEPANLPSGVVITESRIEIPVFAGQEPWLAEILDAGQLAAYRAFLRKRHELEALRDEEMSETGSMESDRSR